MASFSYAYRTSTYNNVIPPGGTVVLLYPLEDAQSGHVNQSEAEVVVGNRIMVNDTEVGIEFDEATTSITVTNMTDEDWPPQTDVVVTVPSDLNVPGVEAVLTTLADHEARLDAVEGDAPATLSRFRAIERRLNILEGCDPDDEGADEAPPAKKSSKKAKKG